MNFYSIGTLKRPLLGGAMIFSIIFSADGQEPTAKAAIYRVGDPLLEIREAVYTEKLHVTRGFLETHSRLQNVVQTLLPQAVKIHQQFNDDSDLTIEEEIEGHFNGLEAAAFYATQKHLENHHDTVIQQEQAKVDYLENRICHMMRIHFGGDEDFREWAKKWTKEYPLELPDEEEPAALVGEVFANNEFMVTVDNRAPEGHVTSDDVHFEVIEKDTGKSVLGKGGTVHTHDEDGTPKRFLGYEFEADGVHFFMGRFGRLEITSENGKVTETHELETIRP